MGRFSHLPTLSSSSYTSVSSTARRRSGTSKGFPKKCFCGLDPVMRTSTTVDNPGRRLYGCRNYDNGGYHIMKWWDEAMVEEFQELTQHVQDYGESIDAIWVTCAENVTVEKLQEEILKTQRDIDQLRAQLTEQPAVDIEVKRLGETLFQKLKVAAFVFLALIISVCVGFMMF